MQLERDHVYLIPPGAIWQISDGTLRLSKPLERHGARMPFDFFLRSLAKNAVSAPSARSSRGPAPTAVWD
jgi:chemotaxis response regulator CheB